MSCFQLPENGALIAIRLMQAGWAGCRETLRRIGHLSIFAGSFDCADEAILRDYAWFSRDVRQNRPNRLTLLRSAPRWYTPPHIVADLKGSIGVPSDGPGRGSTFRVRLPLALPVKAGKEKSYRYQAAQTTQTALRR